MMGLKHCNYQFSCSLLRDNASLVLRTVKVSENRQATGMDINLHSSRLLLTEAADVRLLSYVVLFGLEVQCNHLLTWSTMVH